MNQNAADVAQFMLGRDNFSQWLGIELLLVKEKYCKIQMRIRPEMINGLGTVHGGILFSFADSALAFSSNNTAEASVALNCTINFIKACKNADVLIAESQLVSETRRTGIYEITIRNAQQMLVSKFTGTVYKLNKTIYDLEL